MSRDALIAALGLGAVLGAAGWMSAAAPAQDPDASAPGASPGAARAAIERVLLVSLDTTRRDRLGAYGGPARTPVIDRLAANGVVFDGALAPTPVTLPSHVSLFTGLYPPRHGVRDNARFRLAPEAETLAEAFRAAGFRTAAFVSAFVLDAQFGLAQGFDVYEDRFQSGLGGMPGREERDAAATTEMALRWLAARGDSRWFLFLHYFDAHHPYVAPAPHAREGVAPYDAELGYVDAELGRVLAHLERAGLSDGTLVIVTADHGESLGEHGEATHGIFVYDSTLAVPWVMSGPGLARGARLRGEVSLVDVAPTILALAGLAPLLSVHGRSLAAEARGEAPLTATRVYAESFTNSYSFGWSPVMALVEDGRKLVLAPRPELFDRARDPGEKDDLAGRESARVAAMRAALEAWHGALAGDGRRPAIDVAPTDEERARLEALGYASGPAAVGAGGRDPKDGLEEFALLQRAGKAHDDGDLAGALALYERILAANPRNAVAAERAGMAAIALGRAEDGIRWLAPLDLFPGTAMFALAQAYAVVGKPERTLELVATLRAQNPKFMPAHLFVAEMHERLGERAEAVAAYRALLEHWHGDPEFRRQIELRIDALGRD